MPRTSSEALASAPFQIAAAPVPPPDRLSEEAAELWRSVLDGKPSGWFTKDIGPLLEAYVQAVAGLRLANAQLALVTTPEKLAGRGGLGHVDWLMKLCDRQARLVATLATKLRLSPQARVTPKAAAAAAARQGKKPWESD